MGRYQAYESYKDSGVEWLGDIPEHWQRSVFRYYFDIQLGKMLQNEPQSENDEEISYLKAIHVRWDRVEIEELPKMWASPKDREKYYVQNGDLLICEGGEVGRTSLLNGLTESCIIQNALHRIRPSRQSSVEYLNYLMRHIADTEWFDILCNKSTIAHLTSEKLGALSFPLPPLEEQKTITRFLDYKTKQIDALIAKKETLLEKLDEKRTALISHAVTKGLDANVPMKDSGIEWLGEIPEHWEVIRQRFLISLQGGSTPSKSNPEFWDGEIPWISSKDMKTDRLISSIDKITEQALRDTSIHLHSQGGIVIVARGMILAHSFPVAINDVDITINQDLKIIRTTLNSEYLALLLRGIKKVILGIVEEAAHGTKVLRTDLYKNIRLPIPPLKEQKEIAEYLDRKTAELDSQKAKIQEAIELLKEYRTSLITNAVTGKIDVRQVPIPNKSLPQTT
ncbi:MAG: restriction endonuclease subunit S [Xenococcaceae cyanobacterium]